MTRFNPDFGSCFHANLGFGSALTDPSSMEILVSSCIFFFLNKHTIPTVTSALNKTPDTDITAIFHGLRISDFGCSFGVSSQGNVSLEQSFPVKFKLQKHSPLLLQI